MEKEEILDFEEEPKKRKKKLKKPFRILLKLLVFFIILLLIVILLFSFLLSPVKTRSEVIEFTVDNGSSVYKVGEKLYKQGIIKSNIAYKIYVKLKNIEGYKAGVYKLDKSYNTKEIIDLLTGNTYKNSGITITFKEGITINKLVEQVSKKTNITQSEFYKVMEDDSYIDNLISKYWFLTDDVKNTDIYYPLEGYLFPETYTFSKSVTVDEIIITMLDQTDKVFSKYKSIIDSSSYSINELVTLASIVEKEGIKTDDRKLIAGVFYNRLKAGMSLGSDVTTYYAFKIELGQRDLSTQEINTYNPYNTRGPMMQGKLPVGAISNFGEKSFEAALDPTPSSYYYFVADKSGKTHFTKTYDEHKKVVEELKEAGNWIEW